MFTDRLLRVDTARTPAATTESVDVIDLLDAANAALVGPNPGRDMGMGESLYFSIVNVGAIGAGATTVSFRAMTSATNPLGGGGTVIGATENLPVASIVAGGVWYVSINPQWFRSLGIAGSAIGRGQRFLGLHYLITGAALTGAAFTVDLVHGITDGAKAYRSGFAIIG